jgi:hypothetical protein
MMRRGRYIDEYIVESIEFLGYSSQVSAAERIYFMNIEYIDIFSMYVQEILTSLRYATYHQDDGVEVYYL